MKRYARRRKPMTPRALGYPSLLVLCTGGLAAVGFQSYGKPTADGRGCFDEAAQPQTFVLVDASERALMKSKQARCGPI